MMSALSVCARILAREVTGWDRRCPQRGVSLLHVERSRPPISTRWGMVRRQPAESAPARAVLGY